MYPHSDAELSVESFGSEDRDHHQHHRGEPRHHPRQHLQRVKTSLKKFQFDLEADFPSLSQAADLKPRVVAQSRPITITHGFATADQTASSQENTAAAAAAASSDAAGIKRRRKRHSARQGVSLNAVKKPIYLMTIILLIIYYLFYDVGYNFIRIVSGGHCGARRCDGVG